jgi:hypothetical protein
MASFFLQKQHVGRMILTGKRFAANATKICITWAAVPHVINMEYVVLRVVLVHYNVLFRKTKQGPVCNLL